MEIKDAQKNLIIGEIYRVPDTNEQQSLERYEESISRILAEGNKNTILANNQSFNFLNINEHKHTSDLLELYLSNGLIPTITRPTRITHTSQTLIDNIYINNEQNRNISSGILTTKISDHLPIFTFVKCHCKSPKAKHIKTRLLGRPQPQMYPPVALNQHTLVNRTHKHYIYIYASRPRKHLKITPKLNNM